MSNLLNVFDREMKKVAVLENAYSIEETQPLNQIYSLTFTMPFDDPKNNFANPFYFVRWEDNSENNNSLYRIIKSHPDKSDTGTIKYECEHVISMLCDTTLFGSHTYGGREVHTRAVINWLLSKQNTQFWELGDCEFDRQFEYGWEQENLLNALFSIPKEFVQPYRWDYDTSTFPWKLHLRRITINENTKPEYYIQAKRNLIDSATDIDYSNICTKLYPLGYGEGVNQLNIASVNSGKMYLIAPQNIIDKYGIIEKVLVDRRYENAESLKAYGETVLASLQEPRASRSFNVVDLYPITNNEIDNAKVGKVCLLTEDNTIVYITKTTRVLDDPGNLQIELSTGATDIVSTIADLADRVRIESVYAQGATQLYQHSKDANASSEDGMTISLYFPSEMKQINKVLLKLKIGQFRSYSKTTSFTQQVSSSTENGGGVVSTDAYISGGGGNGGDTGDQSITLHGGSSISRWEGSDTVLQPPYSVYAEGAPTDRPYTGDGDFTHHVHWVPDLLINLPPYTIPKSAFNHTHEFTLNISADDHHHFFTLPSHSHTLSLPSHHHDFTIPAHQHDIQPGIYKFGSPSGFSIYVNGQLQDTKTETNFDGEITPWLLSNGQIPRDQWIDVEIRPNDLAYIQASVFVQGFVQSRGGGNY